MGLTGTWRPGPETMRRALRIVTHSRERRRQPPTRRVIRRATRRFRPGPARRPRPRATVRTRPLGPHANVSAPGTFRPGCGPWSPPLPPIGLTAAGLFAAGEVSRADSRVRSPGSFTRARCPAATSALDAVPEAYHNPAAVWWGAFAASAIIRDQMVIAEPVAGPIGQQHRRQDHQLSLPHPGVWLPRRENGGCWSWRAEVRSLPRGGRGWVMWLRSGCRMVQVGCGLPVTPSFFGIRARS